MAFALDEPDEWEAFVVWMNPMIEKTFAIDESDVWGAYAVDIIIPMIKGHLPDLPNDWEAFAMDEPDVKEAFAIDCTKNEGLLL